MAYRCIFDRTNTNLNSNCYKYYSNMYLGIITPISVLKYFSKNFYLAWQSPPPPPLYATQYYAQSMSRSSSSASGFRSVYGLTLLFMYDCKAWLYFSIVLIIIIHFHCNVFKSPCFSYGKYFIQLDF